MRQACLNFRTEENEGKDNGNYAIATWNSNSPNVVDFDGWGTRSLFHAARSLAQ